MSTLSKLSTHVGFGKESVERIACPFEIHGTLREVFAGDLEKTVLTGTLLRTDTRVKRSIGCPPYAC